MMRAGGSLVVRRVLALLSILLIAGCASPGQDDEPATAATSGIVLEGVVVDNAITPLANVTVSVLGANLTATTDADGRFHFEFAEPASLRLAIHKAGYLDQVVDVTTAAGMSLIQVKLEAVPIPVPMAFVKEWTGIIQCSLRTPQDAYAVCKLADDLTGLVGDDADERYADVDTPPTFAQVEMEWASTQPLGNSLRLMLTDDHRQGLDNYAVATGTSPLMVNADNATLRFKHLDTQGLYIRVFTGDFETTGASMTVQQTFTVYTVLFHHYAPDGAWRFTDGAGIPPA